jgi:hypothetical protein
MAHHRKSRRYTPSTPYVFEALPGTYIPKFIKDVARIVNNSPGHITAFIPDLNGFSLTLKYGDDPDEAYEEWVRKTEERADEYNSRPEVIAEREAWNRQLDADRQKAREIAAQLPEVLALSDINALLHWVRDLAHYGQWKDTNINWAGLNGTLSDSGYQRNAYTVGYPLPNGKILEDKDKGLVQADPAKCALYIVGQVMTCFDMGMPPHPFLERLCDEYFERQEAVLA